MGPEVSITAAAPSEPLASAGTAPPTGPVVENPPRKSLRRLLRWPIWTSLILLVVGVAAALAVPHLRAWYHFRAGRTALERYHSEEALDHFNKCLEVWPDSADVHFLASRAARRTEDYE